MAVGLVIETGLILLIWIDGSVITGFTALDTRGRKPIVEGDGAGIVKMRRFRVLFKNAETGRRNNRSFKAFDELDIREKLGSKGHEIISVEEEIILATPKQLKYLTELGGQSWPDITLEEAGDMIDNALDKRGPAEPLDRAHARKFGIYVGKYANKKRIYKKIRWGLASRADLSDFAMWFVYRVYRSEADRLNGDLLDNPWASPFPQIADLLSADDSALRSLKRMRSDSYVDFRWFGSFTNPEGRDIEGESTRTVAYKFAHSELEKAGLLLPTPVKAFAGKSRPLPSKKDARLKAKPPEASGCAGALLVFFLISALSAGLFV